MKRITLLLLAVASLAGVVAVTAFASRPANQEPALRKNNSTGQGSLSVQDFVRNNAATFIASAKAP